ncbi:MAG: hypothetical protein QW745_09470 [Thermoplasmata archaeon]
MIIKIKGNMDKMVFKHKGSDGHIWKLFIHLGVDGSKVFYWKSQNEIYIITEKELREFLEENSYMISEKEKENILHYLRGE